MDEGSITALLGANGAGKTTTLRALCAMVKTEGEVRFAGRSIVRRSTEDIARLGIAHVPDGRGTFLNLTTEENLRLGAYVRRDRRAVEADLERMFGYFPRLRERRRQQAGTLSGGEQQMLAVSRALMLAPKLMLLDEPPSGSRRSWCASCSRSCAASTRPSASACCWSNRTPPWRSTWPTTPT